MCAGMIICIRKNKLGYATIINIPQTLRALDLQGLISFLYYKRYLGESDFILHFAPRDPAADFLAC